MEEPVIGIDLGTTNSAVATVEAGRARIIPARSGGRLTPSVVGLDSDGERVVGTLAQRMAEDQPDSVVWATKRFLGRRCTPELVQEAKALVPFPLIPGPTGDVRVRLGGKVLPLTQVAAMVLGELKLDAQAHFGRKVSRCVITVPANFDDNQRSATREAASIAGLEVLRLVNEPTAAALAYGLSTQFQGNALVFDLGGGTFDVSILEVRDGVFEVRATGGDSTLGGEDFDQRIVQWLVAQVEEPLREAVAKDTSSMRRLKVAAEAAKRELTEKEEALISVAALGDYSAGAQRRLTGVETALTRGFFEVLSEPLSRRCLEVCRTVMQDAKMDPHAVDVVLLVGGMTRVPLVQRLVADFFGRTPSTDVNPDEAVALGAAIQAEQLVRQSNKALLLDVAGQSMGVGVLGGRVKRLIAKNTQVPVVAREIFLPSRAGQSEVRLPIFQGEGGFQDENHRMGEVVLRNLQAGHRADTQIEVTFSLDSEGILSVRAVDLRTGLAEQVKLEARTSLPGPEAAKLSREQAQYASAKGQQDAKQGQQQLRQLVERAEKLSRVLERGALENPSPEADAAVARLQAMLASGQQALQTGNVEQCATIARQLTQVLSGPPS